MNLVPQKSFGLISGQTKPLFFKFQKKIFFLVSIFSSLTLFELKTLNYRAKTPFLHPLEKISFTMLFKNRTIVSFHKTLFVLDHFIPTIKLFFQKSQIIKVVQTKDKFVLFYKHKNKIQICNPKNMSVSKEIYFFTKIFDFHILENEKKESIVICLSKSGFLEFWSLSGPKLFKILKFNFEKEIFLIKALKNSSKLCIILTNGKILIFDFLDEVLLKRKKIFFPRNLKKIAVFFFSFSIFFVCSSKGNFMYDFYRGKKKKLKNHLFSHAGETNIFIGNSNLLFSSCFSDNFIKIFQFNDSKKNFNLIKKIIGIFSTIEIIKKFPKYKKYILGLSLQNLLVFGKNRHLMELGNFSKNRKIEKKAVRELIIKIQKSDKKNITVMVHFFRKKFPFFWNIIENKLKYRKKCEIFKGCKIKKIISSVFFSNGKRILFGCTENKIILLDYLKKNHKKLTLNHHKTIQKRNFCLVSCIEICKINNYFLSGCLHGTLKLWRKKNLKYPKKLKLFSKIIKIKWNIELDLIFVVCGDFKIYLVLPEKFLIKTVFKGHSCSITNLKILNGGKTFITSSLDKTIKIWHLKKNKTLFSVFLFFPVISFEVNIKENLLISAHNFTKALGFWKIFRKEKQQKNVSFFWEKNGSIKYEKKKKKKR